MVTMESCCACGILRMAPPSSLDPTIPAFVCGLLTVTMSVSSHQQCVASILCSIAFCMKRRLYVYSLPVDKNQVTNEEETPKSQREISHPGVQNNPFSVSPSRLTTPPSILLCQNSLVVIVRRCPAKRNHLFRLSVVRCVVTNCAF